MQKIVAFIREGGDRAICTPRRGAAAGNGDDVSAGAVGEPLAIFAGGGKLPPLVAAAASRQGRTPVVFAIAGEAEPESFAPAPVHVMRWGEIGRLFRLDRGKWLPRGGADRLDFAPAATTGRSGPTSAR